MNPDMDDKARVEFSRMVPLDNLGRHGSTVEITADAAERKALARRFNIPAVEALSATVTVMREDGTALFHLRGRLCADVVQSCILSLEPVADHLEEALEIAYTTDETVARDARDMAPEADVPAGEDDLPELIDGNAIDVGEAVAQSLGLNLNPYPRRPDVLFSPEIHAAAGAEEPLKPSPFAALRNLKSP